MIISFHCARNSFENAGSKQLSLRVTLLRKDTRGMELSGLQAILPDENCRYGYRMYNAVRKKVLMRATM
jgi:hypothetical protein